VQPSDQAPAPDTAARIASTPVDATDQPNIADVATPAQSDTPSPDSQPVPEEPAASPEKTVTAVTPDAKPATDAAPQLAPTSSPRPPARPKPSETPPEDTQTAEATPDPTATDTAAADQAAIDAALADATAPDTAATTPEASQTGSGGTGDQPIGAALNSGEIDNLRRAIQQKWNIGSLSTTAAQVIVVVAGTLSQDGKVQSIGMVSFTGGTDEAAQLAYTAAKSAIHRAANEGLNLPAEKYDDWKDFEFTFDPTNGRLR
jgi:outer membrane biosynthesis protein TonB